MDKKQKIHRIRMLALVSKPDFQEDIRAIRARLHIPDSALDTDQKFNDW